jgi:hypothetical protein
VRFYKFLTYSIIAIILFIFAVSSITAADRPNFANGWNTWSEKERNAFVWGYQEGSRRIMLGAMGIFGPGGTPPPNSPENKELLRFSHLRYEVNEIIPAITSLYADTANAHISLVDIIPIAEMKLNGEDVNKELETYRGRWQHQLTKEELQKLAPAPPDEKLEKSLSDTLDKEIERLLTDSLKKNP